MRTLPKATDWPHQEALREGAPRSAEIDRIMGQWHSIRDRAVQEQEARSWGHQGGPVQP